MTDTIDIAALREQWAILHERKDLDIFITTVFAALEAERQRAYESQAGFWGRTAARETIRANKAEAEIAALKAKLANPVVLKDFSTTSIQPTRPFSLLDIIVATQGADAEAIIAAGFKVKGE